MTLALCLGSTPGRATPHKTAPDDQTQPAPELYAKWGGKRFQAPSGLAPVSRESPTLAGPKLARRAYELSAQGLGVQKLCPAGLQGCANAPGAAFHLSFLSRQTAYFGWGVAAQWSQFVEAFEQPQLAARLDNQGVAGLLYGRLSIFPDGMLDPFVEVGFGAGSFSSNGHVVTPEEHLSVAAATFSPIYQASAGLDVHLTDKLSLGGVFKWTHWLLNDFERCQNVAFGVCGIPGPGRFDLENAVWSLGASASVAFGQSL